jgi:hypothetical protein
MGMTAKELIKQTAEMDPKDRSNALSILKAKNLVRRAGNTWARVA